jgi:predicted RNA binding protein YcfA (HicA-like mRNA interferase family)
MKADLRRLLEQARRRGWQVERTKGSHWRLRHASGALVHTGSTPSCPRALLNLQAHLRRVERREPRP